MKVKCNEKDKTSWMDNKDRTLGEMIVGNIV